MKKSKKIITIVISTIVAVALVLGGLYLIRELKAKNDEAKTPQINRYSTINDIDFNSDKVNIYVFWGKGCEHCEDLYQYLSEIWFGMSTAHTLTCTHLKSGTVLIIKK